MGNEALRPRVAQLEHIALATDDVEGLRDFYRCSEGVASPPCIDRESGLQSCILDFCGVRVELLERPRQRRRCGRRRTARPGSCISVSRWDPRTQSTSSAESSPRPVTGCSSRRSAPANVGCYESVVLDPDGNRLKLTV